jgi:hypothetical protein
MTKVESQSWRGAFQFAFIDMTARGSFTIMHDMASWFELAMFLSVVSGDANYQKLKNGFCSVVPGSRRGEITESAGGAM